MLRHNKELTSVLLQKVHAVKTSEKVKDYKKAVISYKPASNELVEHTEEEEEEEYLYITKPFPEWDLREEDVGGKISYKLY